uniref:Uncharacterized protein n=1 Tax=Chenopodium quinoa TaxID=63459 RepID=A0A803M688_CHEQI
MPGGLEDGTVIPSFGGHVAAYIWGGQERNVLRCLSRTQLCSALVTWQGRLAQEHLELIDGSGLSHLPGIIVGEGFWTSARWRLWAEIGDVGAIAPGRAGENALGAGENALGAGENTLGAGENTLGAVLEANEQEKLVKRQPYQRVPPTQFMKDVLTDLSEKHKLTENLVMKFDTERCCLMLPKRKQEIFLDAIDVHLAYGLPLGGKRIKQPNDESNLKWSKVLKDWRSKFGLKKILYVVI